MATRKSRAPVIPLKEPKKAVPGEIVIDDQESIPKLLLKEEKELVDLIEASLNPSFNVLEKEMKERNITVSMSTTAPVNGESIWYELQVFDDSLSENDYL